MAHPTDLRRGIEGPEWDDLRDDCRRNVEAALLALQASLTAARQVWVNREAREAIDDALAYGGCVRQCLQDIGPDEDPAPLKLEPGSW